MRKRIIVSIHLKRFFLIVFMGVIFIILLSLFIVGVGDNRTNLAKWSIPKFLMKSNNVMFNDEKLEQPSIKVYITKEKKVKEIPLEEYVVGVVASEMPAEFSLEALKAQAVAARTFALAHMEEYGGKKYNSDTGANVCDTVQCQVYTNKEDRMKTWPKAKSEEYWNKINKAVESTKGEVLTYNDKLVMEPYYFAVSSGKTENGVDVFKNGEGYLKSVESNGEEKAPKYKSLVEVSYRDFINKINSQYPNSGLSLVNVRNQVGIKSRNEGGSVKEIKLGSVTISGAKFRTLMGLNSANFNISFEGVVRIQCKGYGHGVGMSQWGANAMAKEGKDYNKILTHYYNGIKLSQISNKLK